jgi:hypothetical protein
MRKAIKMISSKPIKFIPKSHASDPTLKEDAADIMDRPMVMFIRKLTRDEQFHISEMIEPKDVLEPSKGVIGSGEAARFVWENCVTEVRNVVVNEAGEVSKYESLTGKLKDDLWNTEGMDGEITEAIFFARSTSRLDEEEAKN